MSTIVVTFFTTSNAYKADTSVANEGLALISSCEGVLENHHGFSVEDNSVGITIQLATSPDAFGAVVSNKELFDNILEKMLVSRVGDIEQYHTVTVSDPKPALSGPMTEVCLASLKNPTPENKAAFEKLGEAFIKASEGKWTYGWTPEDKNKALIIAAWDSVEAHHARVQEPDIADAVKELFTVIDTNGGPFHLNFVKV